MSPKKYILNSIYLLLSRKVQMFILSVWFYGSYVFLLSLNDNSTDNFLGKFDVSEVGRWMCRSRFVFGLKRGWVVSSVKPFFIFSIVLWMSSQDINKFHCEVLKNTSDIFIVYN